MDKAKRARTAETPKQPSLGLQLRAPYLYPDRAHSAFSAAEHRDRHGRTCFDTGRQLFACVRLSRPSSGRRITAATEVPQKPAATASGRDLGYGHCL